MTITYQWDPSYECAYDFRAKIPPLGASFQTREVDEFENAAETTDTCWYAGNPGGWFESTVPNNMGRGAEWVVQADNHWGPPSPTGGGPTPPNADAVGVYEDAARFYQQNGPNAGNCGVTFVQHMVMSCSRLGTFIEYTNHPIGWSVTGTSFTAFRDQQSVTKPFQ